jgi:hypothetical protein
MKPALSLKHQGTAMRFHLGSEAITGSLTLHLHLHHPLFPLFIPFVRINSMTWISVQAGMCKAGGAWKYREAFGHSAVLGPLVLGAYLSVKSNFSTA